MQKPLWAVQREWEGQTAFIIAGGTSILEQDVGSLAGQRVIAVNSSYQVAPFADICFFADNRWWEAHRKREPIVNWSGRLVTCSRAAEGDHLLRLRRDAPPPGFAVDNRAVASQWTSTQGAMNLAAHLGVKRIVLLGADMYRREDGVSHHHEAHPWPNKPGNETWDIQMRYLQMIVEPLHERGIEVFNTSMKSRLPWWPKCKLEGALWLAANR
jgi:hypothetical protein